VINTVPSESGSLIETLRDIWMLQLAAHLAPSHMNIEQVFPFSEKGLLAASIGIGRDGSRR